MSDLMITSVALNGVGTEAGDMTETFTVQAAKWDLEYRPQKGDGSLDAGVHFRYDQKVNKEG
jgi:type VI secretion system secreted protein Hcp